MYKKTTKAITVTVEPIFLENQSRPQEHYFVWAYHVTIQNNSSETVQIKSRYWHVLDSDGRIKEIRGPGIVGEQPTLKPGENFSYTSGTPLETPSGIMYGTYYMINNNGEDLDVDIPAFSLDSPHEEAVYH